MKKDHRTHRARRVLIAVVAVIVLAVTSVTVLVRHRIYLAEVGAASIGTPTDLEQVVNSQDNDQRFTVTANYQSLVSGENTVNAPVTWDDQWFFQDSTQYNHELAQTASVLSSVANAESGHFQEGNNVPDYMEDLLGKLGFEQACTASYRYRSEIIDEIANVFTPEGTDTTAYTMASKHITSDETGQTKLLLMIAIRGSYGTEWFSNMRMSLSSGILNGGGLGEGDHEGFSDTSLDVVSAIVNYLDAIQEQEPDLGWDDVSLFVCGHSRGGATANLVCAYFDQNYEEWKESGAADEYKDAYIDAGSIYGYGFAVPQVTSAADSKDALYNNIFNIMNPADVVPRTPLAAWGFSRYGQDLWLPEAGQDEFDEKFAQVEACFKQEVGNDDQSNPADVKDVDQIESDLADACPTLADFQTIVGVFKAGVAFTQGHDIVRIIYSHAPDLYSSWMQTITAADLRSSR